MKGVAMVYDSKNLKKDTWNDVKNRGKDLGNIIKKFIKKPTSVGPDVAKFATKGTFDLLGKLPFRVGKIIFYKIKK